MFKTPVGYEFALVSYAWLHEWYFSIEYCTVISDARASEIQNCKDFPILSKLDYSCRNPVEVGLVWESSFWICNNIRSCREKFRWMRGSLDIPLNYSSCKLSMVPNPEFVLMLFRVWFSPLYSDNGRVFNQIISCWEYRDPFVWSQSITVKTVFST